MPVKKITKKKSEVKSSKKVVPIKKTSRTAKESGSSKKLSLKFRREMEKILNPFGFFCIAVIECMVLYFQKTITGKLRKIQS